MDVINKSKIQFESYSQRNGVGLEKDADVINKSKIQFESYSQLLLNQKFDLFGCYQ